MIDNEFRDYPRTIQTACGSTAYIDLDASYPAYRCTTCLAVYGSVGMSDWCHEAMREARVFELLKKSNQNTLGISYMANMQDDIKKLYAKEFAEISDELRSGSANATGSAACLIDALVYKAYIEGYDQGYYQCSVNNGDNPDDL